MKSVFPESSWDLSILFGLEPNGRKANVPTGRGAEWSFSSRKIPLRERGLVNQLHLLQTGTAWWEYTHIHTHTLSRMSTRPYACKNTRTHKSRLVKTHTRTDPEVCGNMPVWLVSLSGGSVGQRWVLCSVVIIAFTSLQKQRDFPLQRAPSQNGLCIHDVMFQCVTAHLEDVSASVQFQHLHDRAPDTLIASLCSWKIPKKHIFQGYLKESCIGSH